MLGNSLFICWLIIIILCQTTHVIASFGKLNTRIHRLFRLKGGDTTSIETNHILKEETNIPSSSSSPSTPSPATSYSIVVTTSYGSTFLDKKKKFLVPSTITVRQLKEQIALKFPGSPPVELQQLFFGTQYLSDDLIIRELTALPSIPILLDMMSGTSAYSNKLFSISQLLDAYVASSIQLIYLSDQYHRILNDESMTHVPSNTSSDQDQGQSLKPMKLTTFYYQQLYEITKEYIYTKYHSSISLALEKEKDPEYQAIDTKAWRQPSSIKYNPLILALTKEFDLNLQGIRNFLYYSIVLYFFASYGSSSSSASQIIFGMIPFLWISKLRHLRILTKLISNLFLCMLPMLDFLKPLFPAPIQVIAEENKHWFSEEDMKQFLGYQDKDSYFMGVEESHQPSDSLKDKNDLSQPQEIDGEEETEEEEDTEEGEEVDSEEGEEDTEEEDNNNNNKEDEDEGDDNEEDDYNNEEEQIEEDEEEDVENNEDN